MKKIFTGFVLVLVFVLSPVFSVAQIVEQNSDQARKDLIYSYFSAGAKIALKTGDAEAKAIMNFLHRNTCYSYPAYNKSNPEKTSISTNITAESEGFKDLCIVTLFAEDAKASKGWGIIYSMPSPIIYALPTSEQQGVIPPLLVLKECQNEISEKLGGLLLLREAAYAMLDIKREFAGQREAGLLKKIYAYGLEARLLEKLGGEKYLKLLQREAGKLKNGYSKDVFLISARHDRAHCLDEIFGESKSALESKERWLAFQINARLYFFNKKFSKEKETDRKAQSVLSLFTFLADNNLL
jgi:hypothetical protein